MHTLRQLISSAVFRIYTIYPLSRIGWLFLIGVAVWTILAVSARHAGYEKLWRRVNGWIAVLYMVLLLYMTVASRSETANGGVLLRPLYSFYLARTENQEYYRSMLMNVLLFFPLGLTLPFGLSGGKRPILRAAGIGMALSVCIEILQYVFSLGWTETDDVIMNMLGIVLGGMSCRLAGIAARKKRS